MIWLIILAILLVVFVVLLVSYIVFVRNLDDEKFVSFCERKIARISSQKSFKFINKIKLSNFAQEELKIDSIIFGKKFIYLVTKYTLIGSVEGEQNDNSWIYFNRKEKSKEYINNPLDEGNKNIKEIAGILGINTDFLVSIALIPNECNLNVKIENTKQNLVSNCFKFNRHISEFENKQVGEFKPEQILEKYTLLLKKNEERKNG